MKRRGRNSSTCPRIFRERRRKVAATILYEVISFFSPNPLLLFLLCLSLPSSLLRLEKEDWRIRESEDRASIGLCSSGSTVDHSVGYKRAPRVTDLVVSSTIFFRQLLSSGPTMTREADDKTRESREIFTSGRHEIFLITVGWFVKGRTKFLAERLQSRH